MAYLLILVWLCLCLCRCVSAKCQWAWSTTAATALPEEHNFDSSAQASVDTASPRVRHEPNTIGYNVSMMSIAVLQVCASTMKLFILQALFSPHIVIATFSPVVHWNWIASQQVLCVLAKSWLNYDRWIRTALFWRPKKQVFNVLCCVRISVLNV